MQNIIKLCYFNIKRLQALWVFSLIIYLIIGFSVILLNWNTDNNSILTLLNSLLSLGIFIGITTMILLTIKIWYQEWFGQAKMINRWLSAPIRKSDLYWAKLLTLLYYYLLTISVVYFSIYLVHLAFKGLVSTSSEAQMPLYLIFNFHQLFSSFINESPINSLIYLLAWFSLVPIAFLAILLERIYAWYYTLPLVFTLFFILFAFTQLISRCLIPNTYHYDLVLPISIIGMGCLTQFISIKFMIKKLHI
ncbi:hypothetical protein HZY91_01900 [Facklamia sp. DSM 111018]|uniref:ABC transporter permease n=1 Tax=Facklamia lactis TaxID=2749967 RepID=A0ABS0LNE3_9LACT|nr:hypothetical protein [Facklamia lactis]MBG9979678.1 hypothetical protein [Facklamia lactis]MBG9985642.1 hypothetical protein [Facklamia lactis]